MKIVIGTVVEIHDDHIIVKVNDKTYPCPLSRISDYEIEIKKFFKLNGRYAFALLDNGLISYKRFRPKLIKNRHKPIPTISDSKNLEKHLKQLIKEKNM